MIAAFCRGSLEAIEAHDRALLERVRASVDPEVLAHIEGVSRLAWLPLSDDVELTRAIFAVAGVTRAQEIFRTAMVTSMDAPLLRPLRMAAGAVFGGSIQDVLRWTPRAWSAIYRDAGTIAVNPRSASSCDLELTGLPSEILEYPNYLLGTAATVEAVFEVFKVSGRVDLMGPNVTDASAVLRCRWVSEL